MRVIQRTYSHWENKERSKKRKKILIVLVLYPEGPGFKPESRERTRILKFSSAPPNKCPGSILNQG
jgi:hypothetical protein